MSSCVIETLDLSKHCGVIIGPSGIPCMRSLTCKSHSMASKRAITGRAKDFDKLLCDYIQQHPPKNSQLKLQISPNISDVISEDLEALDSPESNKKFVDSRVFPLRRMTDLYISSRKRGFIDNYRGVLSFLDYSKSNKITRTM